MVRKMAVCVVSAAIAGFVPLCRSACAAPGAAPALYEEPEEAQQLAPQAIEAAPQSPTPAQAIASDSDVDEYGSQSGSEEETAASDDSGTDNTSSGNGASDSPSVDEEAPSDDAPKASDAPDASATDQSDADAAEIELIQERFPSGAVKIEREVTQDPQSNYVNHGSWKMRDERGNLLAEGHYRNGERTGTWNRWYRNGEVELLSKTPYAQFAGPFISQASFENGKLNGKWSVYDAKQRKISEWEFVDGLRHGKSIWWYADGRKMREINYRHGDIDGEALEWGPDAKLTRREIYQEGRQLTNKSESYSNSQKRWEGVYLLAKQVLQTPDDWWDAKMAVYTKQGIDEKHGPWTSWYENGQKKLQGEYRHDSQIGKFTWWHSNGQRILEGAYDNGKQHGKWTWWYPTGQKASQGAYNHGNPTGRWSWWREDGKLNQTAELAQHEGEIVGAPSLVPNKSEAMLPRPVAPLKLKR